MNRYRWTDIRVKDIDEECVVLKEVISLETAAITDPKVSKKLTVVGWEETESLDGYQTHTIAGMFL